MGVRMNGIAIVVRYLICCLPDNIGSKSVSGGCNAAFLICMVYFHVVVDQYSSLRLHKAGALSLYAVLQAPLHAATDASKIAATES